MTSQAQIYPLDKNRKLLSELVDSESGTIRKVFRVFSPDGDSVDIEVEEHLPQPMLKPVRCKYRIASQDVDADGYLHKLMLMDENGSTREYYITEKIPTETQGAPQDTDHIGPLSPSYRAEKKRKIEFPGIVYTPSDEFIRLLLRTKVEELKCGEPAGDKIKIFVAFLHDKAPEVFKGLIDHQYYSCPVVGEDGKTYTGFVDLLDFVGYFMDNLREEPQLVGTGTEMWELMWKQTGFRRKKIKSFLKSPLSNPFRPLSQGYSLYTAMEILAREPNLHRIPIVNDTNELINIVTQSFVVNFLHTHLQLMGAVKDKPLSLIPRIMHEVETITVEQNVIEAFRKILNKGITGVAVVDKDKRLVGAISTKDVKGIDADGRWFGRLLLPYHQFIADVGSAYPQHFRPERPVYALPTDTLGDAINLIAANKVHRVFVVNNKEEEKPIGIVSLRDILLEIVS